MHGIDRPTSIRIHEISIFADLNDSYPWDFDICRLDQFIFVRLWHLQIWTIRIRETLTFAALNSWRFVFKEGLFLTVYRDIVDNVYSMRAVLAVSSRLQPGQFEGLWGNLNGDGNDDFVPHGGTQSFESPTPDEVYIWANTCESKLLCDVVSVVIR